MEAGTPLGKWSISGTRRSQDFLVMLFCIMAVGRDHVVTFYKMCHFAVIGKTLTFATTESMSKAPQLAYKPFFLPLIPIEQHPKAAE